MKTRDEIEFLKAEWRYDPIWNIETTEGFEDYHAELLAYRLGVEAEWAAEREESRRAAAPRPMNRR